MKFVLFSYHMGICPYNNDPQKSITDHQQNIRKTEDNYDLISYQTANLTLERFHQAHRILYAIGKALKEKILQWNIFGSVTII